MLGFTSRTRPTRTGLALLSLLAAAVALSSPAEAAIYVYENTTGGTFADQAPNNAGFCGDDTPILDRTFDVTDSFTVNAISVGLTVTHGRRGDVRAELFRPGSSTPFVLIPGQSGGGDTNTNYDVMITQFSDSDGGTTAINDNSTDPTALPFYNRLVASATLNSFWTGNSVGTWTLRLCDVRDNDSFTGTFVRARLVLSDSQTIANGEVCSAKVTFDWSTLADGQPFPGAGVALGGVTLTLNSTLEGTFDAVSVGGYDASFESQTDQLGGVNGFYYTGMDLDSAAELEQSLMRSIWNFSLPVNGLTWTGLDIDWGNSTSNFEDYWRVLGFSGAAGAGTAIPFVQELNQSVPGVRHQVAGDIVEGDSEVPHANPGDSGANVTRRFLRGVSSVVNDYMAGDAFANPGIQYVSIADFSYCVFDFGDAPDSYGTLLNSGSGIGARHVMNQRDVYLGAIPPDGELEGQPSADASDDNDVLPNNILSDEDGVTSFPVYTQGSGTYTVSVRATNTSGGDANLRGFIDWDNDGTFNLTYDRSANVVVPTGSNNTPFNVTWSGVPALPTASATIARFRIATNAGEVLSPTGLANSGEVEDYQILAGTLPVTLAWVTSAAERGGVAVRFMTATETRNAGFRVWGLDTKGSRTQLGLIRSKKVDSFAPQSYEAFYPGTWSAIEIEDIGASGQNRLHGPFTVGATAGERPETAPIDWAAIRAENARTESEARESAARSAVDLLSDAKIGGGPTGSTALALIKVREAGIQRVTYEQLLAAGIDLAATNTLGSRLALFDHGVAIPRYVSTTGLFGPGSYLEFLFQPELTLASPYDAIELRVDRKNTKNPPALPSGTGDTAVTEAELARFPELIYSSSSPTGDPWYEAELLAFGGAAQVTRTFDLPDLVDGPVELRVKGWGYSYFDGASPDHHIVVRLNGTELTSETFDGLTPWNGTFDVTDVVQATGNTLEIVVPGDTGYIVDLICVDGFSVAYPRLTVALEGRFQGRPLGGGAAGYAVDGLADGPVSIWTSGPGGVARGEATALGGRVIVPNGLSEAWVAQADRLQTPEIVAGVPTAQASKRANYLIITHPSFADSLGDLVALEQSRGFSTAVVTVDRIYAAYSDHAPSAEAIRRFVAASSQGRQLKYVLLVGADSSDPYDHFGLGSISFVPTAYLPVVPEVSFSPTDEAIADTNGDLFPDVPIGRLPVRTLAELDNAIAKLYAWDQSVVGSANALLVAGASDSQRALATINETYAGALGGWGKSLAQVDDLGVSAVRQQALDGMNAGVPLVSFVGHSSPAQWDFTPILHWQDVDAFTNVGRPNLVTQWGCWNSYYVEPIYECMSGRLMRASGVGAAGTIGAATLTSDASHRRLGVLFFQQLASSQPKRLGDAFLAAKQALRSEGGAQDAILGMALLGDPAMPLPAAAKAP